MKHAVTFFSDIALQSKAGQGKALLELTDKSIFSNIALQFILFPQL